MVIYHYTAVLVSIGIGGYLRNTSVINAIKYFMLLFSYVTFSSFNSLYILVLISCLCPNTKQKVNALAVVSRPASKKLVTISRNCLSDVIPALIK